MESKKISVLIVDQKLGDEPGKVVNAAFVIGLTAGKLALPDTFGGNVCDGDGSEHTFLTNIAHFVRKASQSKLRSLRAQFIDFPDITVVDYAEAAAPSNYEAYAAQLQTQSGEEISYRAIYVYGPEEVVVPLSKNLSRL